MSNFKLIQTNISCCLVQKKANVSIVYMLRWRAWYTLYSLHISMLALSACWSWHLIQRSAVRREASMALDTFMNFSLIAFICSFYLLLTLLNDMLFPVYVLFIWVFIIMHFVNSMSKHLYDSSALSTSINQCPGGNPGHWHTSPSVCFNSSCSWRRHCGQTWWQSCLLSADNYTFLNCDMLIQNTIWV